MVCAPGISKRSYEILVGLFLLGMTLTKGAYATDKRTTAFLTQNVNKLFVMESQDGKRSVCIQTSRGTQSIEKELNREKLSSLNRKIRSTSGERQARLRDRKRALQNQIKVANSLCRKGKPIITQARVGACLRSDLNHDSFVDNADLQILLEHFGERSKIGDLDSNGLIDIRDLAILLANFGCTPDLPGAISSSTSSSASSSQTVSSQSSSSSSSSSSSRTSSSTSSSGTSSSNSSSTSSSSSPPPPPPPWFPEGEYDLDFTSLTAHPGKHRVVTNRPKMFMLVATHPETPLRDVPLTYTIASLPQHGTITGNSPLLTYTPNANYVGEDSIRFYATDGVTTSNVATVNLRIGAIEMPIGHPAPRFGMQETHLMYAGQKYDFDGDGVLEVGEEYKDAGNGPYTHYVDRTNPQATNSNNAYGSPARPRTSVPETGLRPGSVVEVHGTGYAYGSGYIQMSYQGTQTNPIFIRGVRNSDGSLPRFNQKITFWSSGSAQRYTILENVDIYKLEIINDSKFISVRDSIVRDGGGINIYGTRNPAIAVDNIVLWNLLTYNNGDFRAQSDVDSGGNVIGQNEGSFTSYIWVLDSQFTRTGQDGLMILNNAGNNDSVHHMYVGRNESWEHKQVPFALKEASDVIYSENTAHTSEPMGAFPNSHPSAWGSGMAAQYNPYRVSYLYNHIYNCSNGISTGSSRAAESNPSEYRLYIIGNYIHHIWRNSPWNQPSQMSIDQPEIHAITLRGMKHKFIIGNTILGATTGIYLAGGDTLVLQNNIVADMTENGAKHFRLSSDANLSNRLLEHNIFTQLSGSARLGWNNSITDLPGFRNNSRSCATCIETDPRFTGRLTYDATLQSTSPAINTGAVDSVYAEFERLYGQSIRVDDGQPDIGAFEYVPQ